jgi:hypothetical protein
MRVANYSAVARYIQDEVENIFGNSVDPNTIVTAVMRLSHQALEPMGPQNPLSGSRLNLVTGVSELTIEAPPVKHTEIMKRIMSLGVFDSYMLSLHQFSRGLKIMTNAPDAEKVKAELSEFQIEIVTGYAEVHITLPYPLEGGEGGLTAVVDVLAQNGVHAVDALFTGRDISMVVKEEDAGRAFEIIRGLIR